MSRIIANNIRHNDAASDSLSFDSSARVGIGTASPTEKLHVSGSGGTVILVADSSDYAGLSLSGSGSSNFIVSDDRLDFLVNGSTRASILTTGGLTFNGDTSTDNALDDYEEGTWTPALNFGGASTGISYALQRGTYTKVGNVVRFVVDIQLSSKGSATGAATIAGLPFSISNTNGTSVATGMSTITTDGKGNLLMLLASGTTSLLRGQNSNSNYSNSAFGNSTIIRMTGTYQVS